MAIGTTLANRVLESTLRATAWTPVPAIRISLHNADPGPTGANEIAGAGYARQIGVYGPAAGGQSSLTAPVNFPNMPAGPVTHVGIWSTDATPLFLYGGILGGPPHEFVSDDVVTELLKSPGHGLSATNPVRLIAPTTGALPVGLLAGTQYFVSATGFTVDVFAVSATSGGAVVNVTATGSGFWYLDGSKVMNTGDTFILSSDVCSLF